MPTNDELIALCYALTRVQISAQLGDDLAEQHYKTLMRYMRKVLRQKAQANANSRKWNRENKERHNELNKASYKRVKSRKAERG